MRAIEIQSPGKCGLTQRPEPKAGPGNVLLRVRLIGYCGSDLNTFRGLNPLVSYPRVPGHEVGATVESVCPGVPAEIRPSMDVTVLPYTTCGRCNACLQGRTNACRSNQTLGIQRDGALAQFVAVPWEKVVVAPGLSLAELALVEPLSVGFHAVERARVKADDTVMVLGCGMIGLGAIAGAALGRQARVIAVDVDDAKLDLARAAGAWETINSRSQDLAASVAELTDGHGPGATIEAVGSPETFVAAVDLAAFAGRVVYIGYSKSPVTYETKHFILKELDILGSRNATAGNFRDVVAVLQARRYPVSRTITRTVVFDEAPHAMERWAANPGAVTKIQVTLDA
ncbi:MAG: zinc-binding alcohol dehydrogenase family protein [Planctomycetota bacterium]|nr:zinc-binding alcohol dehydrogenase family protein [Planctomycetota bacterium]